MSGRGPQALRDPSAAQDRKLHQLSVPARPGIVAADASASAGAGSSSSWDDSEVARQIALLTEERNFLRKYVSRCEHELKAYQLQYPELVGGKAAGDKDDLAAELSGAAEELPPWIGQAKYMSPLLVAYEARIEELTAKNQEQLHDFATLKSQYDALFKRNSEAEAELESNIKNLLANMDAQKGNVSRKDGPLDEDEVAELQEQVALYKEQLDIVASQKLELEAEVGRAHAALAELRAERDSYWTNEMKKLQTQMAQLRQERDRLAHSSTSLSQTQLELSTLQKEHAALQKQFLQAQVELESLERDLESSNDKERTASANLLHAERDLESLLKTLQGLERELEDARGREVAGVKRESDALAKMEAMRTEKAQAVMREQNAQRDIARMEEKLQFEMAQAHRQAEEEVAALYARGKDTEEKLQGEIASLSLVIAELEAQKDKFQRDAVQLRSQTDQVVSSLQSELLATKSTLAGAQSQLSEMHLSAEAHLAKLRRGEAELARVQEFAAKERQALQESLHALKLKNENLTLSNQNLGVQVGRLNDTVARMEKDAAEFKRVSEFTISKLQAQLVEVESARKSQVDELQQRLEEAYRMHEASEARTRELLVAQDTLSAKWREENKHVRAHLGKLLTEEKTVTAGLHQRLTEMEARGQQLIRERDQAMNFQAQYEQLKVSHEATVGELSHRINVLTGELSTYSAREPEYLLAAKTLQGKLDRAEIEVKRLTRQYEAARKKAEFLENTHVPAHQAQGLPAVLTSGISANLQSQSGDKPVLSSSVGRAGGSSTYAPIPFAQSMLPPTFHKASA